MNSTALVWLSNASYMSVAVVLTILGPLVPDITAHFGVGFDDVGAAMFPALFAFLLATLLGGWLCSRYNAKMVVFGGLAVMVAGYTVLSLAQAWWQVGFGYMVVYGVGFGIAEPGINALVIGLRAENPGPALNILHMFAALGAMLGPIVGRSAVAATGSWQAAFLILAVTTGIFAVVMFLWPTPKLARVEKPPQLKDAFRLAANPIMITLALSILFYVGAELGTSQWMYSYLVQEVGSNVALAAAVNSSFWLGMGLGRLVSAWLSSRWRYEVLLLSHVVLAVGALSVGVFGASQTSAALGLGLTGFFFAGTFPILMAMASRANPGQGGVVSGFMFFGSGLGALVFPPSMGYVAEHFTLHSAMFLALISALILTLLASSLAWRLRTDAKSAENSLMG